MFIKPTERMNQPQIDEARTIREGEELNIENLQAFLNKELNTGNATLEISQFPSGFSNLTYLLKLGDKELVLRRPPFGAEKISKGHDMGREYKVLSRLNPVYSKAPKPLVYTEDLSVIGAPFYVMERVKGVILRSGKKVDFSRQEARILAENFIHNLARLHKINVHDTGLIELGKPDGYMQRQVEGWIARYKKSQTDDIRDMDEVMEWFPSNIPESKHVSFIHNDYKYDNIVLSPDDPTQIKAVLDWEMSTVGDPLSDLATALAYTNESTDPEPLRVFGIKAFEGVMSRDEMVRRYEAASGIKTENMVFHYAFASFKLGVICQQIYYRYKEGFTKDPRFAPLIFLVKATGKLSASAVRNGRIRDI